MNHLGHKGVWAMRTVSRVGPSTGHHFYAGVCLGCSGSWAAVAVEEGVIMPQTRSVSLCRLPPLAQQARLPATPCAACWLR